MRIWRHLVLKFKNFRKRGVIHWHFKLETFEMEIKLFYSVFYCKSFLVCSVIMDLSFFKLPTCMSTIKFLSMNFFYQNCSLYLSLALVWRILFLDKIRWTQCNPYESIPSGKNLI
ncbi:hypothetical protein V8G54_009127 [Vigna mungo]|uniref:Uncharacterized protein n=1 Tax=Vigna mungo TaxID=3915 RepID=A0AAQ3NUK5_VIGMU